MLKLTRLNRNVVAVNPDHITWADASPDTTLFLIGGEKLIVRESLDDLIERVVEFRRLVRAVPNAREMIEGEVPAVDVMRAFRRSTRPPPRAGG
jgi:flagellar protein FlbD